MSLRAPRQQPPDLLRYRPLRRVDAEDDGVRVVVLRPRFLRGPLAWWLQPRLTRPHYRVKLDELGSFIWRHCDGQLTVAELARDLEQAFGDRADRAVERIALFLRELDRGGMVELRGPESPPDGS